MRQRAAPACARRSLGGPASRPASRQSRVGALLIAVALGLAAMLVAPPTLRAAGPNAVLTPTGYNANTIARGDDTSNLVVNLPFTMNWNGTTYNQIYINMNGNCTFGSGFTDYNPTTTLAASNAEHHGAVVGRRGHAQHGRRPGHLQQRPQPAACRRSTAVTPSS